MKKTIVASLCVACLLVGAIGGFVISNSLSKNDIAGTYKTSTWNGKDAVLVLSEDGTCIHPSGYKGTWSIKDEKLIMDCPGLEVPSLGVPSTVEVTIVPSGVMLSGHFFEKL